FEAFCVPFFVPGKEVEQVAVGEGAQGLGAAAVGLQAVAGEDARLLQAVEGSQGDAVAAVELVGSVQQLGVELGVRAGGLGLRQRIGAFSFMNSHRCLSVR